ncbi:penicillin-binding protein activator [Cognatishimia sp. F0-27]|uniref:penicillin-binding protein activator n=1 Tax=Cognatishimia sp. F0-27 TaxID=2816855 RepID=UPI001D0C2FE2|nr:penicillin-binding protein activator [Cognatishimia sp. F0-27]MCC1493959.1 penicillin-binding protein activator [Cognatishimia sp. F0-27]
MFAALSPVRKRTRPLLAAVAALFLAACDASMLGPLGANGGGGPSVDPNAPIQVALLIPKSDSGAAPVAQSLENAVRLAIAENPDVTFDLRVYDTAGSPNTAAAQAQRAVDEGAKIILGPLFGEAANAAGLTVLDEGVNVLSFSNNPSIAGGNVFVLGPTFQNTANRLLRYARTQGDQTVAVVYSDDVPGQFGRLAVERAATAAGMTVTAAQGYALSVEGVNAAAQAISAAAAQADSLMITTDATNAAMPMLLRTLPDNGVSAANTQYIGLTRLDVRPDLFSLPGAEGMWFTLPNQSRQDSFAARYRNAFSTTAHPLAGLGYDGIAAIAALAKQGRRDALTARGLTQANGFNGTGGLFRLLPDGSNERALAVAAVRNNQVVILDPAPNGFGGAGF